MNKILVIISDDAVREEFVRELRRSDLEISSSGSFHNGFARIKSVQPDILVLDAAYADSEMPSLQSSFPHMPVVGWMDARDAQRAVKLLELGVHDCLHPPVRREEILAVLRHALQSSARERVAAPVKRSISLRSRTAIVLGAAAVLVAAAIFTVPRLKPGRPEFYRLAYGNPIGICRTDQGIWTADWYAQKVYRYRINGGDLIPANAYSFPDFNPSTLTPIGKRLALAASDGTVRLYDVERNKLTPAEVLHAPNIAVSGICQQGDQLWITDADSAKIYRCSAGDPVEIREVFDYPGTAPVGIFWDGRHFWTADAKQNTVYCHEGPDKQFEVIGAFPVSSSGGGTLAGLGGDATSLWLIFAGETGTIARYPRRGSKIL